VVGQSREVVCRVRKLELIDRQQMQDDEVARQRGLMVTSGSFLVCWCLIWMKWDQNVL